MTSSYSGSSKRAHAEVSNAIPAVTCLVDACATDLSDSRKYYQRHKVCEIHSKSPQVSINGQILRFCQQCSRFHSLVEFDEGKRSCRKRLDGHNKRRRRRKPRPDLFPPYNGTNMVQSVGQQLQVHPHPTMALRDTLWSEVVQAPPWLDQSNRAHYLLSSMVPPPQSSISRSSLSHVVNPWSDSGSASTITTSSLDQGPSYVGLENDCDVGWSGVTNMDTYHHVSYDHEDPQTFPFYWQS